MKVTQDQFGFGTFSNTLVASTTIRNKWDYDIAARFGIAFDRALVYGKAGWVAGRFDWNAADVNCGNFCSTTQGGATLDGLLIGLGLEYAFFNNWTAKFEYDYLGFGSKNVVFTTSCPSCSFSSHLYPHSERECRQAYLQGGPQLQVRLGQRPCRRQLLI